MIATIDRDRADLRRSGKAFGARLRARPAQRPAGGIVAAAEAKIEARAKARSRDKQGVVAKLLAGRTITQRHAITADWYMQVAGDAQAGTTSQLGGVGGKSNDMWSKHERLLEQGKAARLLSGAQCAMGRVLTTVVHELLCEGTSASELARRRAARYQREGAAVAVAQGAIYEQLRVGLDEVYTFMQRVGE